ncbi:MAG: sodium:calcium symporter [Planctomycetes bacterium GWF2_41_51]|nr:MAG: sodium:calcium symporter [Planctomycetes bacterium GWF2_41_51]HBG28311.1 sodium:calcium symporter [Phycisphaerales bacterium]
MARQRWTSKLGVVLAVAGSAIGLGNFLRFPVQVAGNGGGAFMIPYFVALLLVGLPLMWIEWTIGRFGGGFGHSTAPGIFHSLWNKSRFIKYFGVIGIFGPMIIFIYYIYIESWLLGYSVFAIIGKYNSCTTEQAMTSFLQAYQGLVKNEFFSSITPAYFFFIITFIINVAIVYLGISKGIERVCEYALPVLFAFALILLIRVLTLGTPNPAKPENNIVNGLGFLWNPDWSALKSAKVWMAATGQIFFTLSCGIGMILTYASYLTKQDDVALSGLGAAATNEFAEVILGGSIVIPAAFVFFGSAGAAQIAQGGAFNLGFVTMPLVMQKIAFGNIFGFMWFMLLFLAGITSSISLAQPAVAFLEDEFNFSRRKASGVFAIITFILCQPVIFFLGRGVLDELDFWSVNVCLIVFATIEAFLFAWVFGMEKAWTELHTGSDIQIPKIYRFIIKYITPLFLLTILSVWCWQDWRSVILMQKVAPENKPFVLATRIGLVIFFVVLAYLVRRSWRQRSKKRAEGVSSDAY